MRKIKRLTLEERKIIEKYSKEAISGRDIARIINRGDSVVNFEFQRAGGRENYNALEAQKTADERFIKRINRVTEYQRNLRTSIEEKIFNLEMQIEILTETIRRMRNATN